MGDTLPEPGSIHYLKRDEISPSTQFESIGIKDADLWSMWLHLRNPENRHGLKEEEDLFQVVHKSIMLRASMVCVSVGDVPPPPTESNLPPVTWKPG